MMASVILNDCNETVGTVITVNTTSTVDMGATTDTMPAVDTNDNTMATIDTVDTMPKVASVDSMGTDDMVDAVDTMGSGDATSPFLIDSSMLTLEDVQDLILPDPSIMDILPPLVGVEQLPQSNTVKHKSVFETVKDEVRGISTIREKTRRGQKNLDIQNICSTSPRECEGDTKVDLAKFDALFRCEACQEMPIPSETVHTCDFGHQVCGDCYSNGIHSCSVCKGPLFGNNAPLEIVLRRLRENCPYIFRQTPPLANTGEDFVQLSRFFSCKPLICPEGGCGFRTTATKISEHFRYEHKHVPTINLPLFEPCTVLVPKRSLDNVTYIAIAAVTLSITDEEIASKMDTKTMTCWVQCGVVNMDNDKALVIWVSCAYVDETMPPILCNIKAPTARGYSSFGGQMIPLLHYTDPQSVLASGKCLLLLPKDIENVITANEGSLVVELKFYLQ